MSNEITIMPHQWIGKQVRKKSGKPFKSGFLINTVKDTCTNEHDPKKRTAFTFEEDESMVNIDQCELAVPGHRVLRVTMTKDYILQMSRDGKHTINGWNIQQVIDDWFHNHHHYHATREGSAVGGSERFVSCKVISLEQAYPKEKLLSDGVPTTDDEVSL